MNKLDALDSEKLFLNGPSDALATSIASYLKSEKHFKQVFGESVEDYQREDFSIRELPAARVYNLNYRKESESHYINGDIHIDVILPPSIRRQETEVIQNRIAAALMQQFRRPTFFSAMKSLVPGLNELGKIFSVDKSLGFQTEGMTDECPVTKIILNFRIDLKAWDDFLENQGRTKDEPFDVVIYNLKTITALIQGLNVEDDLTSVGVELRTSQKV